MRSNSSILDATFLYLVSYWSSEQAFVHIRQAPPPVRSWLKTSDSATIEATSDWLRLALPSAEAERRERENTLTSD